MTRKGYGRNWSTVKVRCNSQRVADHVEAWLDERARAASTTVTNRSQTEHAAASGARVIQFDYIHIAHNEDNAKHDIRRRLTEHMARYVTPGGRLSSPQIHIEELHSRPWKPLACPKHPDGHCHTSAHKQAKTGQCTCDLAPSESMTSAVTAGMT